MFGRQKWVWIAAVAALAGGPAAAQQGGITSGGTTARGGQVGTSTGGLGGSGGSSLGGTLGSSTPGGGSSGFGSSGGTGGNSSGGSLGSLGTSSVPSLQTSSSTLQQSNVFAGYYGNPTAKGFMSGTGSVSGASFGALSFGTSSGSNNPTSNRSSAGGLSGQNNSSNQSGILIPIQTQMNYSALMRFDNRSAQTGAIQAEIRSALDRTSMIADAKGVQVVADKNNNVTLRGAVADDDESRLIEGLVRLTPGVGRIKNELKPAAVTAGR